MTLPAYRSTVHEAAGADHLGFDSQGVVEKWLGLTLVSAKLIPVPK